MLAAIETGYREARARPSNPLVTRLLHALQDLGIDTEAILERCGASAEGKGAWPGYGFWEAAVAVSGQQSLGVRAAERVEPNDFGLLGQLVSNSATLGEALFHGLRLSRLSLTAVRTSVIADSEETCVMLESVGPAQIHSEESDFIIAVSVRAARKLTGNDFVPLEVTLAHDPPRDWSHHRKVFRCPLRFCATQTACTLPTSLLLAPLPHGDTGLLPTLSERAEKHMAEVPDALPQQVRSAILSELRNGPPTLDRVSDRIGTCPRTLNRRLGELGLSYREILAQTRFELAEYHLRRPGMRVTAIAEVVGYSDKSAFIRAFKRYSGCSPMEYRRRVVDALQG